MGARSGVANGSRECGHERKSRMGVASVVANASREWESRTRVTNGSREWESRMGVANVSRESELQNEVANGSHEMASPKIKKIGGVCKWDPEGSN